jgi:Ca-activated chloride channel family protein
VRLVVAAAALAGLLLAAGRVHAQSGEAEPVAGGGSFNAAPLLEPGRYRDTVLNGEYLYYAFALESGQRPHVRVRILDIDPETYDDTTEWFSINLHTPQRETLLSPVDEDVAGNGHTDGGIVVDESTGTKPLRWDFYGPAADAFADAVDESSYEGPGTWYVSLHSLDTGEARRIEIPVELELDVDGEPVPEERDPRPVQTSTPTPAAAPEDEDGGGAGALAVLGIGALGVAAGLVAGTALGRRRS